MDTNDRGRWPEIILIYGVSVLAMMCISEAAPVLADIGAMFHAGPEVGWVMSMPALVTALCALFVGGVVDRFGDRPVLLAGTAILIVADLGDVAAQSMASLLSWRVVGGVGYVCVSVAAVTMVTRITEGRRRTAALALWSSVIPASFIGAFFLASILTAHGHWRAIFVAHAALAVLALGVAAVALPAAGRRTVAGSRLTGLAQVLRSPLPYALGVSFAFNAFIQTGMIASFGPLLAMRLGVAAGVVQPFTMLAMLFNIAGALAVGRLLNRGARPWIVAGSAIVLTGAAGILIALGPIGLASAIALDCLVLLGCGLMVGLWALLPLVAPSFQTIGATSGLITQLTLLGVLFGPPAAFASLGHGGAGVAVFLAVALVGCLAGLPVWLRGAPAQSARPLPAGLGGDAAKAGFH